MWATKFARRLINRRRMSNKRSKRSLRSRTTINFWRAADMKGNSTTGIRHPRSAEYFWAKAGGLLLVILRQVLIVGFGVAAIPAYFSICEHLRLASPSSEAVIFLHAARGLRSSPSAQ